MTSTPFGSARPFEESSQLLSKALGFPVSSTAVQWNTENAGGQLDDDPYQRIDKRRRSEQCDELVVQMDSTTSPQITAVEGVSGRESLKAPTEWKMCHVGTLQRLKGGKVEKEWTVGRYGTLDAFGMHLGRAGLAMGMERAERVTFLSTGSRGTDGPAQLPYPYTYIHRYMATKRSRSLKMRTNG